MTVLDLVEGRVLKQEQEEAVERARGGDVPKGGGAVGASGAVVAPGYFCLRGAAFFHF